MKITYEIREFCNLCLSKDGFNKDDFDKLRGLADRIDNETVELPKDADGKAIHMGDTLYISGSDEEIHVNALRFDGLWEIRTVFGYVMPSLYVHKRPDSWERIADEIEDAEGWCDQSGSYGTGISSVAESTLQGWADRIRKLAEKEDE